MTRNNHLTRAILSFACSLAGWFFPLSAVETGGLVWSGISTASFGREFSEAGGDNLASFETRLIVSKEDDSIIGFRGEGGIVFSYGSDSGLARAVDAGLADSPDGTSLPPGTDLHREAFLDQAYAFGDIGPARLKFGIMPAGNGAAWLYNPTSRMVPPRLPEGTAGREPGIPGLSGSLPLPAGFSVDGGVYATPRLGSSIPATGEIDAGELPLILRLQYRSPLVDLSLALLRELEAAGESPMWWIGADAGFDALGAAWYAEGAFRAASGDEPVPPGSEALTESGITAETSCGVIYSLPFAGAEFRSEYLWFSAGAGRPEEYDIGGLLDGSSLLMGRSYLFASLEWEDPVASRWKVTGGALGNMADRSVVLLGETVVRINGDLEAGLGCRSCLGPDDGEFTGSYSPFPGVVLRPWKDSVSLEITAWF